MTSFRPQKARRPVGSGGLASFCWCGLWGGSFLDVLPGGGAVDDEAGGPVGGEEVRGGGEGGKGGPGGFVVTADIVGGLSHVEVVGLRGFQGVLFQITVFTCWKMRGGGATSF